MRVKSNPHQLHLLNTQSRTCRTCGLVKPDADFYPGRRSCNTCCCAKAAQYYQDHRDTCADRERVYLSNETVRENRRARKRVTDRARRSMNRERFREKSRQNYYLRAVGKDHEAFAYSAILRRDPCSYCGRLVEVAVDHIVPVSRGGQNDISNLTASCRSCNSKKCDRSLLAFLLM